MIVFMSRIIERLTSVGFVDQTGFPLLSCMNVPRPKGENSRGVFFDGFQKAPKILAFGLYGLCEFPFLF